MFARNKDFLNHKRNVNTKKPNVKTLQHYNVQIDNILKQCNGQPNQVQKKMIKTALENIAYLANHSLFKSRKGKVFHATINKAIKHANSLNIVEPVQSLQEVKTIA